MSSLILKVISFFNTKIKLGVIGRRNTFDILQNKILATDKTIWMHAASLGEFEQGLPVLQELKIKYTNHKIIVSFFSPSGYEVKKNTNDADVGYINWSTKSATDVRLSSCWKTPCNTNDNREEIILNVTE